MRLSSWLILFALVTLLFIFTHDTFAQALEQKYARWAIDLATNSSQFQSIVKGYNYSFYPSGFINETGEKLDFVVYNGTLAANSPAKIIEVFVDMNINKILVLKEYPAHADSWGRWTNGSLPDPLKQIQSGIFPMNVHCNFGYVLIKDQTGNLDCFKPQTAQKLVERGWGKIAQTKSYNMDVQRIGFREKILDPKYSSITYEKISNQTLSQLPTVQMALKSADMLYEPYAGFTCTPAKHDCGDITMGPQYMVPTSINSDEGNLALEILNFSKPSISDSPIFYETFNSIYIQYDMKNYSIAIDPKSLPVQWIDSPAVG